MQNYYPLACQPQKQTILSWFQLICAKGRYGWGLLASPLTSFNLSHGCSPVTISSFDHSGQQKARRPACQEGCNRARKNFRVWVLCKAPGVSRCPEDNRGGAKWCKTQRLVGTFSLYEGAITINVYPGICSQTPILISGTKGNESLCSWIPFWEGIS